VASDSVEPGCLKSDCPIQKTVTCELKYDTNPIGHGILKFVFLDVKILILSSDRFSYLVSLSVFTDKLEECAAPSSKLKTCSRKITIHTVYAM
jgi:hypothetical protein